MFKRLTWLVLLAAAAAGGCLTGSGAVRGKTLDHSVTASGPAAAAPVAATPAGR